MTEKTPKRHNAIPPEFLLVDDFFVCTRCNAVSAMDHCYICCKVEKCGQCELDADIITALIEEEKNLGRA